MASLVYNPAKAILGTTVDWIADDIRVLVTTPDYVPDPDHEFVADITDELSGTGYSRLSLTGRIVTPDPGENRALYQAADASWANINAGTAGKAIVYKHVTNDADSPVLVCVELEEFLTDGGDWSIEWDGESPVGTVFRISQIGSSSEREWWQAVRTVATANITLANTQTVSGVALVAGDRCWALAQTDPKELGPYIVVAGGAWLRAPDFDTNEESKRNRFWIVTEGTHAGKLVAHTTPEPIVLGTTNLTASLIDFAADTAGSYEKQPQVWDPGTSAWIPLSLTETDAIRGSIIRQRTADAVGARICGVKDRGESTQVQAQDVLAEFVGRGYDAGGSAELDGALLQILATGTWSGSSVMGARLRTRMRTTRSATQDTFFECSQLATTNATQTDFPFTFPLSTNSIVDFSWRIIGHSATNVADVCFKSGRLVVRRGGSGDPIEMLRRDETLIKTDSGWGSDAEIGAFLDLTADGVVWKAKGEASNNITWTLEVSWVVR